MSPPEDESEGSRFSFAVSFLTVGTSALALWLNEDEGSSAPSSVLFLTVDIASFEERNEVEASMVFFALIFLVVGILLPVLWNFGCEGWSLSSSVSLLTAGMVSPWERSIRHSDTNVMNGIFIIVAKRGTLK
jgi:hypothetical protein